ncbi:MAG: hypothetical protein ACYC1M_07905 [Armatimonadota bacterium]
METEFKLSVYSKKYGHRETYRIGRIDNGWHIEHIRLIGDCDKDGNPSLYRCLRHDSVSYPANLPQFMEQLWEDAALETINEKEVQHRLDKIGDWISVCEENAPDFG